MVAAVLGLAEPPQPPDVADALALAVCHLTTMPLRHAVAAAGRRRTMIGLLRGTLAARTGAAEVIVDVGGVGYRVAVTPATAAAARVGRRRRSSSTCTPTFARTPSSSTGSSTTTSDVASRRCSGRTGSGPPWPSTCCRVLSPAALSTAVLEEDVTPCAPCPAWAQDGGPAAHRPAEPPRPARPVAPPPAPAAPPAGRPAGEARAALVELGYAPRRSGPPSMAWPMTGRGGAAPPGAARAGRR